MSGPLPSAALKAQSSFVSDPRQLPTRPLEQVRERVIEALSEHFARDNISLDDLEIRMARVYAATRIRRRRCGRVDAGVPDPGPPSNRPRFGKV